MTGLNLGERVRRVAGLQLELPQRCGQVGDIVDVLKLARAQNLEVIEIGEAADAVG